MTHPDSKLGNGYSGENEGDPPPTTTPPELQWAMCDDPYCACHRLGIPDVLVLPPEDNPPAKGRSRESD